MYKRVITILLLLIVTIPLSSCKHLMAQSGGYNIDKYRAVDYHYDEELDAYYLEYQNVNYFTSDELYMFNINGSIEDFFDLGWYYNFPFTFAMQWYSYTTESPDYMFSYKKDTVYFKETIDYKKEIFLVEDTQSEIEFSELFTTNTIKVDGQKFERKTIYLHSKKYDALSIKVELLCKDGNFYFYSNDMDTFNAYQITENFYNLLIEIGIII